MVLTTDVILHIGSFLGVGDAVNLTQLNKEIRQERGQLLQTLFVQTFGQINEGQQPDKKIIARLLGCAEKQPNAAVDHNIYKAPKSRLERWKWIVGVENTLDKQVQENYDQNISLLENTRATSIIQLKHQMQAFWHSDRQIKDYAKFKSDEQARATSGLINKIFFKCIGFVFKLCYNPSVLKLGKNLEERSRETFATIGKFKHGDKDHDVVAFHILADEASVEKYRNYRDDTHLKFTSIAYGKTYIGIFERNQTHFLKSLGHHGGNHNFSVQIGREIAAKSGFVNISSEKSNEHGEQAVSKSKRHLLVDDGLEYRDRTQDVQGSDRVLDQRLTQIMVEMAVQNEGIISLRVGSYHDDLPVLTAGGFESHAAKSVMKELEDFRSKGGNKLFPPYKDYRAVDTAFRIRDFAKEKVKYSRGSSEAWSDIILRSPILTPNAGVLPEYWARKPKFEEE